MIQLNNLLVIFLKFINGKIQLQRRHQIDLQKNCLQLEKYMKLNRMHICLKI